METRTTTQTMTHARHVASKVAADLKRLQRIHLIDSPSDSEISAYQEELVLLLNAGYLHEVTYGFKREDLWMAALKYRATNGHLTGGSDDPGGIRPYSNIAGSYFSSFLICSASWDDLLPEAQEKFIQSLPIQRQSGNEPALASGRYWGSESRNYLSGGIGVGRSMIQES